MITAALRRRAAAALTATLLGVGAAIAIPAAAHAVPTEYFVTSLLDDGSGGTLREAITDANANDGIDTITIQVSGTITLTSGLPVSDGVTIEGPGMNDLVITRSGSFGILNVAMDVSQSVADRNFTLRGLTLDGNTPTHGVGVDIDDTNPLDDATFDDVRLTDFTGAAGGRALVATGLTGELSLVGARLDSNDSPQLGGAGSIDGAAGVIIQGSIVEDNLSGDGGGGLSINEVSGTVSVVGGLFRTNVAQTGGGGLLVRNSGSVEVTGTVVEFNESNNNRGGGIAVADVDGLDLKGAILTDNFADIAGGAVAAINTGPVTIEETIFNDNDSNDDGGALYTLNVANSTIVSTEFIGNTADRGGAIFAEAGGPSEISDSSFVQNSVDLGSGGAIYATSLDNELRVLRSEFDGNSASNEQGGSAGGAVYLGSVTSDADLEIDASTFTANSVTLTAGGGLGGASIAIEVLRQGFTASILNSTFAEEVQVGSAAIAVGTLDEGAQFLLRHSTVVASGGMRIADNEGGVFVSHSIVNGDSAGIGGQDFFVAAGDPVDVEWSLLSSLLFPPAVNDNGGNQFDVSDFGLGVLQDNGGPTRTMLPTASSPAVNAGNLAVAGQPEFDQRGDGFPRILGERIDVGAVEVEPILPATGVTMSPVLPIGAGILLLGGMAALWFSVFRRRGQPGSR